MAGESSSRVDRRSRSVFEVSAHRLERISVRLQDEEDENPLVNRACLGPPPLDLCSHQALERFSCLQG